MKIRIGMCALALVLAAGTPAPAAAQVPFTVTVQRAGVQPAGMPGLQSFAVGTWQGRWLLVGGRRNGFHRTSDAESTFPSAWANDSLYVVDPTGGRTWRAPLPAQYRMRLRVNNMEHHQDGRTLYFVGGYGSDCDTDARTCYQTYPTLTAIDVPGVMDAVMDGTPDEIAGHIVSITDERMRVAGGALKRVDDDYYLVFGQNYDSIYKGGYTGKYTESVRRFQIAYNGSTLAIDGFAEFTDPVRRGPDSQYHRRDLNLVEAVGPGGALGLTVYGGVFTRQDGAWLNPVYITPAASGPPSITVDQGFSMKMSPYECAQVVMYDAAAGTMYTTLLGGISFYYYDRGRLVPSTPDNWLPFVNTISTLARGAGGTTTEVVQPEGQGLPGLLGANAAFVPNPTLSLYGGTSAVLDYGKLPGEGPVLLGHMVGGIRATNAQASEFNPTVANNTIYEVVLNRAATRSNAAGN